MKLYLLDADYFDENNRSVIRLFCKDSKGGTVVALDYDFYPYFYVLPKKGKMKELKKRIEGIQSVKIKGTEIVKKTLEAEQKLVKVYCYLASDISKARDIIKAWRDLVDGSYEYSLNFYKRYLIDKGIEGWIDVEGKEVKKSYQAVKIVRISKLEALDENDLPKLKLMAFDTETIDEGGKQKLIMISLKSDSFERVLTYKKGKGKFLEVLESEERLLERFVELVNEQDPDILFGYNTDEFDFQVLRDRADAYPNFKLVLSRDGSRMKFSRRARVSTAKLNGRVHIDLFQFIRTVLSPQLQTEVLTLDAVSSELLNDKKIEKDYAEINDAWKKGKGIGKLAEYCLKDSELALNLGKFMLPQIYQLAKLSGQLLFDASRMTYSQLVEGYLSKKAFAMNMIIPNQPKWSDVQERRNYSPYVGGFVKEPIGGLHDDIAVLDFRSLYPSIIATFNISPETFNCSCCKKNGFQVPDRDYWFCKKRKGFVSSVIRELIERRERTKERMKTGSDHNGLDNEQFAVKTVANATYGYFGFPGSKWYCRECADSSAAFGRFYIKKVIEEGVKEGFEVIYADTDSMFVKSNGDLKRKVNAFLKKTNKILPGILKLELQGIYRRGIFIPRGVGPGTAKKRYALIDRKGVLTIRGLEKVRKDWSNVAKDTQEQVLKLILEKKDVDGSVKYVRNVIRNLRNGKIPLKDLIIIEQLTKPLSEYRLKSPHVVAAQKIKERGRPIGAGMPILFVITKGKGSISDRAEPFEDAALKDIDNSYYISNQIVPAALRVLTVLGVTEQDLLGESLKSFLK
ncbi:MAG: DNA-directed DNA polymerase [Candidatus Aenigmatarchaeota archaeon]